MYMQNEQRQNPVFSIYLVLGEGGVQEQEEEPGRFSVPLPYPILFNDGVYSCALEECFMEVERENSQDCLDVIIEAPGLISPSMVNSSAMATLAVISTPAGTQTLSRWKAGVLICRPVVCGRWLEHLIILLKTPSGGEAKFKKKRIMLHIIFFRDI